MAQEAQPPHPEQFPPQGDLPALLSRIRPRTSTNTSSATASTSTILLRFAESQASMYVTSFPENALSAAAQGRRGRIDRGSVTER